MRNCDRSANHQGHVECIQEFCACHSAAGALFDVISDAIIATQDDRTTQAHQLFGFLIQCAVLVSLCVQRKKSLDAEVIASQKFFVHLGAITIKLVHQNNPFRNCLPESPGGQPAWGWWVAQLVCFSGNVSYGGLWPESSAIRASLINHIDRRAIPCFHPRTFAPPACD